MDESQDLAFTEEPVSEDSLPEEPLPEELIPGIEPVDELQELVRYMASSLVDDPSSVEVTASQQGSAVHISLQVPESEMGRVIGRQGRIARAMRTLVMIAGSRNNLRVSLDIEG